MEEKKNIAQISVFCMLLFSCVDPFKVPSSLSQEGILVVEGRIGDQETNIRLSRTANLDTFSINPEINAVVQIEDEFGNTVAQLTENEFGEYFSDVDLIFNEPYRIRIETDNQEVYISDYTTLVLTPPISSLEVEVDISSLDLKILLSTRDPNNSTRYYLWDYSETYEYKARFVSILDFDGENVFRRSDENQITVCWKTDYSSDILLQSSIQFEEDIISKRKIKSYKLADTQKFMLRYSIEVNQYALSAEEYEFWSLLEKNTESLGTLFDPQPSQITSNLECASDPKKRVIGYIGSSSTSQKRIFVSEKDLPRIPSTTISFCPEERISFSQPDEIIRILSNENFVPLYPDPETNSLIYTVKFCADCREKGGTNVKPNYWF